MPIANILHSGQAGDILYSLAAAKTFKHVNFYIKQTNLMSKEAIDNLIPLIKSQPYIIDAKIYERERIDFDFDRFREFAGVSASPLSYTFLNLYQRQYNIAHPWLDSINIEKQELSNIIINRTRRYVGNLDYREIVNSFKDSITFIGMKDEYEVFVRDFGDVRYYKPIDLLEAAKIIRGSKMFIGNQSVCYAIAEGLKHPRLLEVSPDCPNCHPIGEDGYSSWQDTDFLEIIKNYMEYMA